MSLGRLATRFVLLMLVIVGVLYLYRPTLIPFYPAFTEQLSGWAKKSAVESPARMSALAKIPNTLANWPPRLNQRFPSVRLFDHEWHLFDLEKLRGKPTLIEFIAMTCAACQAWSGAHKYGPYDNFAAQADLESIEKYFYEYSGGIQLFSDSINFVQLIIYNTNLEAPTAQDLQRWRAHFKFDTRPNTHILTGGEQLRNRESFFRTPGFLLLDKELIVRFDSLGHSPRHNLYTELLPAVPRLLN